jgi:peroxiredoxin Q/BCP
MLARREHQQFLVWASNRLLYMSDEKKLVVGDEAPNFDVLNQDAASVSLGDYKGKKVILYFYPAASTPGCTKEACDFNDSLNPLKAAGYHVLGISPDAPKKLEKFHTDQSLNFPLLSDPELGVHKAFGAYGKKSMYGKEYEGVIRSTFVIDETGKIALALYNVKATGHVAMLRKQLAI